MHVAAQRGQLVVAHRLHHTRLRRTLRPGKRRNGKAARRAQNHTHTIQIFTLEEVHCSTHPFVISDCAAYCAEKEPPRLTDSCLAPVGGTPPEEAASPYSTTFDRQRLLHG